MRLLCLFVIRSLMCYLLLFLFVPRNIYHGHTLFREHSKRQFFACSHENRPVCIVSTARHLHMHVQALHLVFGRHNLWIHCVRKRFSLSIYLISKWHIRTKKKFIKFRGIRTNHTCTFSKACLWISFGCCHGFHNRFSDNQIYKPFNMYRRPSNRMISV